MRKYYFFTILLCSLTLSLKSQTAEFSGGKGTEAEPYLIKTAQDIEDMVDAITPDNQFANTYFQLVNDIVLEDTQFPIGSKAIPFKGVFDGNNKTISNLIIFPIALNGSGFFGGTDGCAVIKNLTISSARIVAVGNEDVYYVGGICGFNKGKIINCTVSNTTIQGSKNIGGIVGSNMGGTIENCNFSGKVSGGWWVAGIVGTMDKDYTLQTCGDVTNCYNTGEIFGIKHVGGIAGALNSKGAVNQCYNIGNIAISGGSEMGYDYETEAAVGGICGFIASDAVVEKCANFGKVESIQSASSSYVGGIVGRCYSAIIQNCYNTSSCSGNNYASVGGIVGSYAGSSKLEKCYTTAGGQSDYKQGMITPDPGSSLIASINDCYYDKQMHRPTGGPGDGVLTKEMIGEKLKDVLGIENWIFEESMYPRLKGMETLPNVILAASPIICYSNADGSEFDRLDYLEHSVNIPTGNAITWKVDNSEYLKVDNKQVILLKRSVDELISATLTASLGNFKYEYSLSITADLTGDGSKENPYLIKTAKQFNYFALMVADGETYISKYFKLTDNLDMKGNKDNPSIPVGAKNNLFQGTFDGNQKVITNFYYKTDGMDATGLFRYVGQSGVIKELTLGNGSYIEGSMAIGGIVGQLGGTVYNCSSYATVIGITNVGGIAGSSEYGANNGLIYNCYNAGEIRSTRGNVGGIMGNNSALNINKCYNFGFIQVDGTGNNPSQAGGILGYTSKALSDCINYGTVAHQFKGAKSVAGGIVGRIAGSKTAPAIVSNCINVGNIIVATEGKSGAIAGTTTAYDILTNCYYDNQMCIDNSAINGSTGLPTIDLTSGSSLTEMNAAIWSFSNGLYPLLKNFASNDAAQLAAAPIYLSANNTFRTVSKNFRVGGKAETVWASSNQALVTINEKEATITLPDETTPCILTATSKGNSKDVCLFILDKKSVGLQNNKADMPFSICVIEKSLNIGNTAGATIQVFDVMGKICNQKQACEDKETIHLPITGIYILKISKGEVIYSTKILIK